MYYYTMQSSITQGPGQMAKRKKIMRYNIEMQPDSENVLINLAESMDSVSVTNYTPCFDGTNDLGIIQFDEELMEDVDAYLDSCDEVIVYR